mgnify:CR=1 FL=1
MSARRKMEITAADADLLRWMHSVSKNSRVDGLEFCENWIKYSGKGLADVEAGFERLMALKLIVPDKMWNRKHKHSDVWRITTAGTQALLKRALLGHHTWSIEFTEFEQKAFWAFCSENYPKIDPTRVFLAFVNQALSCHRAIRIRPPCVLKILAGSSLGFRAAAHSDN